MSALKPCPEFLDADSPQDVEVYQLTTDYERSHVVYPDRTGFLHTGRSMILTTSDGPQICHLDEGCALQPLSEMAEGIKGFTLAPNGRHIVFKEPECEPDELKLHRLDLQTGQREEIFAARGNVPNTEYPLGRVGVGAVSYNASRIGSLVYLDYDRKANGETGVVILDTATNSVNVISNQPLEHSHLRYFTGPEEPATHHLMFQHHHGHALDKKGKRVPDVWAPEHKGVDLHVIRDDGTGWSDLPFGRDGVESCIGHQLWRWPHFEVATIMYQCRDNSYGWADGTRQHLVTGHPVPTDPDGEHMGRVGREEHRHLLSQNLEDSRICHLGIDRSGLRFAFDTFPVWNGERAGMGIYIGKGDTLNSPLDFHYILNSGVVFGAGSGHCHAHPILSPNGEELFFNSNYYGSHQAYMVKNLPWS